MENSHESLFPGRCKTLLNEKKKHYISHYHGVGMIAWTDSSKYSTLCIIKSSVSSGLHFIQVRIYDLCWVTSLHFCFIFGDWMYDGTFQIRSCFVHHHVIFQVTIFPIALWPSLDKEYKVWVNNNTNARPCSFVFLSEMLIDVESTRSIHFPF